MRLNGPSVEEQTSCYAVQPLAYSSRERMNVGADATKLESQQDIRLTRWTM